jgi:glycine/D-amino acid oxidase-like deaminating enzyme
MDLRSGHPYWLLKNGLLASYPSLRRPESCAVAVLGGGITGALVAYHLAWAGIDTVLLDKRDVGAGSTAASTALLQYAADTELIDLAGRVGEAHAVRSYQLGLEAVDKLEGLVARLGDTCGFQRRQSLYLASKKSHVPGLRREYELRLRTGFDVRYLEPDEIRARFPFAAPGALLTAGDAEVDAFRLTHRLLQQAAGRGLRVYDRTAVSQIDSAGDRVVLTTDRGFTVTARRVVFATGFESQHYLKQKVGALHSTFALISEPLEPFPPWPDRCLIWETARPYLYLRTTTDDRVMVGGGDTPYATDHRQDRLIKQKTRWLKQRFLKMFPDVELEVAYAWAGTFGSTRDGLAYIGQTAEWPNAYFALGYGGNGITFSVVAAELITADYLGRPSPDAAIFRFDR